MGWEEHRTGQRNERPVSRQMDGRRIVCYLDSCAECQGVRPLKVELPGFIGKGIKLSMTFLGNRQTSRVIYRRWGMLGIHV